MTSHPLHAARSTASRRRGSALTVAAVLLALVGAAAGGAWYYLSQDDETSNAGPSTVTVERGPFIHDVVEQGEVESSENVEIRCEVRSETGGLQILWVIPEGTNVQKGDEVCKLDSAAFEKELTQQEIVVSQTKALLIQAQSVYEAAEIAKKEYLEGTFKQEEQTILNEVFAAKENLERAQLSADSAERLAVQGLVRSMQMEADRFAVEKAKNELELAETKLTVLREFTKAKMLKQLDADITSAKADWDAQIKSHELELQKLADIREQIEKCTLIAPQDGQVVYANEFSRRGNAEFVVEAGATVRERQVVLRLPDSSKMQVKATVNESKIAKVKEGMPATIRLDAFEDLKLKAEVTKVNQYAEPTGWSSGGVKEYAAFVKILDPPPEIRTGMNAEVNIHVERTENALTIPVEAICEHKGKYFCMVQNGDSWETRRVKMGSNNEQVVTIVEGLKEGDEVALSPRSHPDLLALPDLPDPKLQLAREIQPALKSTEDSTNSSHAPDAENNRADEDAPVQRDGFRGDTAGGAE